MKVLLFSALEMPEEHVPVGEQFFVRDAIAIVFARMPAKLRKQFAYQHFYTDSIDPLAQCLSIKFFSLLILYYCSVFRLEGRRRQYLERQTGKSGRDFAKAHEKTRVTFEALSCCYSSLVMRYNCHNIIEYTPRASSDSNSSSVGGAVSAGSERRAAKTGPYSIGLKVPLAARKRAQAFEFASDELVFFEMLYQASVQIVTIAFEGDANIQHMASEEVNKLFRSRSFLFHEQKRSLAVAQSLKALDKKAKSLLENNQQLAELLSEPPPHVSMRLASAQRTPFVACTFPGQQSTLKYARVRRPNGEVVASVAERDYSLETKMSPFPLSHRAKATVLSNAAFGVGRAGRNSVMAVDEEPVVVMLEPPVDGGKRTPSTSAADALSTSKTSTPSKLLGAPNPLPSPLHLGPSRSESLLAASALGATMPNPTETDQLQELLRQPLLQWATTDLYPEISSIYQALANGVVVTNFGIPSDLQLLYDEEGLLITAEDAC